MRKIDDSELIQMIKERKLSQREMAEHFGCSQPAIAKMKRKYKKLGLLKDPNEVPESFKNLTEKEQKFVIARLEGKNQTQAALNSFECNSVDSAKNIGSQLMKRDDIQKAVSELMHEEGLAKRSRVQVLRKHVYAKDPNVSLKALDQSWKLDGAYAPEVYVNLIDRAEITANIRDLIALAIQRGLYTPKVIEADVVEEG